MIYDITNHNFVKCEKCETIIAYEDKDTWIRKGRKYSIFDDYDNNFTWVRATINCPKCGKRIIVSEDKEFGAKIEDE